jgi:hypothetical protein
MKLDDDEDETWTNSVDDSVSTFEQQKSRLNAVDAEIDAAIDEIMGTGSTASLHKTPRRGSKSTGVKNEPVGTGPETERLSDDALSSTAEGVGTARPPPSDDVIFSNSRKNTSDEMGIARWIKAYQTMPLRVTASKPPISARQSNIIAAMASEAVDTGVDPVDSPVDQQIPRLDRSPRFVRKHDSITTTSSRPSSRRRKHAGAGGGPRDSVTSSIDLETTLHLNDNYNDDSLSSVSG